MRTNYLAITILLSTIFTTLAAYATHLTWWIKLAMNEQLNTTSEMVIAILGTVVPPIGVVHGLILWF